MNTHMQPSPKLDQEERKKGRKEGAYVHGGAGHGLRRPAVARGDPGHLELEGLVLGLVVELVQAGHGGRLFGGLRGVSIQGIHRIE